MKTKCSKYIRKTKLLGVWLTPDKYQAFIAACKVDDRTTGEVLREYADKYIRETTARVERIIKEAK